MAGLELDDWQQFVLRESLGERADGRWAAQTVGLCVGRQNGKNALLEARQLAGLFLLGERLIVHTAHMQKTASEHFRRLRERIETTPELAGRVAKVDHGKGTELIELHTGQRIGFSTRMGSTYRGFTIDLIVYDEAMHLSEVERSALTPTMAAQSLHGNTQTWYTGSAVDQQNPKHDGVPFAQIREAGINGSGRVAYFEWSCPGDDPERVIDEQRQDMGLIAQANPGLGIRISEEWVAHERDVELGPRGFAVERMGIGDWPDPTGTDQRPINPADWARCVDPDSRVSGPVVAAFDVSPDRARACIAVAGLRADKRFHVEVVEHKRGAGWVPEVLAAFIARTKPTAIVADMSGQASSVVPQLAQQKIEVTPVSAAEHAQGCGMLFDAVQRDELRHLGTPELKEAIDGATKKPLNDRWKWNRRDSTVDISPLVAVTLALWGGQTLEKPATAGAIDVAAVWQEMQEREDA